MDDPIPGRISRFRKQCNAVRVSEAHLESKKLDSPEPAPSSTAIDGDEQSAISRKTKRQNTDFALPSEQARCAWERRNFAVSEIRLALQTGAISGGCGRPNIDPVIPREKTAARAYQTL